jgi:hypothetical protein
MDSIACAWRRTAADTKQEIRAALTSRSFCHAISVPVYTTNTHPVQSLTLQTPFFIADSASFLVSLD